MEKKNYIVAIDLGVSNIVIAVATPVATGSVEVEHNGASCRGDDALLNIEYITSIPSAGFVAGKIDNIELAAQSISEAVAKVREELGLEIFDVYAGVSGESIYCTGYTDHVFVSNLTTGITQQDVNALFDRMRNVQVSEDKYIMERIPQNYVVDDTRDVKNPVGTFGSRLSSTFNFIISENTLAQRVDLALRRQNIKLRKLFSNAVVVGDAVLTPDEKEEGVAVVDIGGGLTNVAVYYRNVVRYISTIPVGANTINDDIRTLMIPERYIEKLKVRYGYAIANDAPDTKIVISGRTRRETKEVLAYNLAVVIESRVKDIAEFVVREIKDSGYADKLPYGIVLTGGSAQLRKIDKLFSQLTKMDVRIAEPEDVISRASCDKITSSADSTIVGLLLHGLKHSLLDNNFCEVVEHEIVKPEVVKLEVKKTEIENSETKSTLQNPEIQDKSQDKTIANIAAERGRFVPPKINNSGSKPERSVITPPAPQPSVLGRAPVTINSPSTGIKSEQNKSQEAEEKSKVEAGAEIETEVSSKTEEKVAKPEQEPAGNKSFFNFKGLINKVVSKVHNNFDVSDEDDDMI